MANDKPVLIIVAGPNGSGKTSVTEKLLRHQWFDGCEYINPDAIAQTKFNGWNDHDSIIRAANYAEDLREQYLSERKSFVIETVFSHESKLELIHKAIKAGYFVRFFFISTNNPRINAARIADRVMQGGHDVPIKKIVSRYSKSINNSIAAAKIVDRAYFYDNSIDDVEANLLVRITDGKISKQYVKDHSEITWFSKVLEGLFPNIKSTDSNALNSIETTRHSHSKHGVK